MGTEPNSLTSIPAEEDRRSSSEIESDIRQTRDRLDDTLERLNDRLSPRSLINDLLSWFDSQDAHRTGSESSVWLRRGYRNVVRQIKENPVPALLIGAGITWMIVHPESDDSSNLDTHNAYRGDDLELGLPRTGEAQRVAASTTEEARRQGITPEAAGDKVSEIADKVGAVATQAKEEAARAAEEEGLKPGAVADSSKQRGGETQCGR